MHLAEQSKTINVYFTLISDGPGQASISPTSSVLVGQPIMLTCTVDDPGMVSFSIRRKKI